MSIGKRNIYIPDTLRGASINIEPMQMPESLFIHLKDFVFTELEIVDRDFWLENLGLNLFPLHGIEEFNPEDTKNTIVESLQKYSWNTAKPIYKHRFLFNWALDYHKIIEEISSIGEIYAIYTAKNYLRATTEGTNIRGFRLSAFLLEPFTFSVNSSATNSELFIEHYDSNELNVNGYQTELDWQPKKVDRLPVSILLTFTETIINLEVRYLGQLISGITASDITIYDKINGLVNFSTFVPDAGYYQLSNFDKTISSATLFIKSRLYIGCKSFLYNYIIKEGQDFLLMTGESFLLMSATNFLLMREGITLAIDYGGFASSVSGYRKMYFRITNDDEIVEDLTGDDFSSTSGNASSISYLSNGVYVWFSNYADTGTLTILKDGHIGSMSWDLTGLFYEANMRAMWLAPADSTKYLPPLDGLTLSQNETLTNPLDSRWRVNVSASRSNFVLTNAVLGQDYTIDVEVLDISTTGKIEIFDGTNFIGYITSNGTATFNYTATSNVLYFYFSFNGGPLDVLIDSIKITKN